ncbi:hypothetical protein BUALT_Bualt01G0022800 [Buddleja alternifolia]|uniref:Uncharacterized protein n=1 Tax=Buddleja alternifolia TaxID=168488 RepID=A0AAV6Y3X1_9LAMI|nr:hypothetical protein BUALT_Bualt01G0022800 [Buddleja alternifolia]
MSRCFPYPPPGHTLSKASNEALIESIKLQKLKEEKEQRKKEKREKKEKKKEKKEKRKEKEKKKEKTNKDLDKSGNVKGGISKKIWTDTKDDFLHKRREAESEQLERSSLTEENGQPVCLRSTSSDSTENSNKRKRHSSSLDGSRAHSKIILVRLPSKKQKDIDSSLNQQQLNSTSGRIEKTQNKDDIGLRGNPGNLHHPLDVILNVSQSLTLKTDRDVICSTSGRTEDSAPVKIRRSVPTPMQRVESQYKDLIVNWVPPQLDDVCLYSEDLDWLCPGTNNDASGVKRPKLESDSVSCSGSSGLWPRAQYLSDVGIYVLPYTVPF